MASSTVGCLLSGLKTCDLVGIDIGAIVAEGASD